jgi:membrane protein
MMPNVRVRWSSAFVGGLAIALLIAINHRIASLYVGKVTQFQSLYGELSIVLVLMFGTYLTWLFVLIGGQIAYAYQNRYALARHKAWEGLSHRARRTLAFVCISETLRPYARACLRPWRKAASRCCATPISSRPSRGPAGINLHGRWSP